MMADELTELLERDEFEPFRLRLTSGDAYEIHTPRSVAMMRNRFFLALPDGERWEFIPFLHVAAIESISNGRGKCSPRKKK